MRKDCLSEGLERVIREDRCIAKSVVHLGVIESRTTLKARKELLFRMHEGKGGKENRNSGGVPFFALLIYAPEMP